MISVQAESTVSVEDPRRWSLLRRALASEPTFLRPESVLGWFRRTAPWVDLLWVEGAIEAATVNYRGRRHYPSSQDLIYRHSDGSLERSDPNHLADDGLVGRYEIERGRDAVSELKLSRGERSEMTGEDPTCMCLREG